MVINVTKLMATNTVNIKQIIAEEYKRCAIDPVYFFKKYCYIQHPTLSRIKFNLFKFQEKLLSELFKFDYSLILKSRQMGISTLSAGISLHLMIFNKDKNVLVIATKQEVAKNMVNKVRFMYDNLPSWLKEPYVENNKLNLKLANGSQIKASSSSGDAGRSEAVSMLIVDEAAFITDIEEIWGSAQQTLACIDKNSLISTDRGLFRFAELKSEYFDFGFNDFNINIINRYGDIERSNSFYISKESDTLELEFEDGNKIIVTKKHPLLINSNNEDIWIKSENLKIGDKIKCLYNTNIFGNEIVYPTYKKYREYNKSLSDLQVNNDDMAYLTGLWIAEGHFGSKKVKSSPIVIANSDIEIQNWLRDKFGFKLSDDRHSVVTFSELYKRLIWLGCKRVAKNKNIPNKILHSSKSEQISFLQGMFDGNGCATKRGNIKYSSVSKQLVLDLHHVLLNFGIKSHIKFIDDTNSVKGHKSTVVRSDYRYVRYNLLIYGENARKFFEIIGFRLHRKQKRYNDNSKNENLYEYKELEKLKDSNKNYYYNMLISIKDAGKRITYDLKVPSSESFLANFIVNHNTGGKSIVLSCVTKDTMIFTNNGLSKISNFIDLTKSGGYEINEYSILGYGKLRNGNLFYNNGMVKTKKIKTKFSELECSLNHKLFAYIKDSNEYAWPVKAEELKIGDYLAIQKNYNIFGNDDSLCVNYSNSNKIKNDINLTEITEDLSYLFGWYISEGNDNFIYDKNNNLVGGNLYISCGDNIDSVINRLNLNFNKYDDIHYNICSKNLLEIFDSVGFNLTKKAKDKIIPDKLLKMSKRNIIQLLRGLFDGAGCSCKSIINYVSTSEELINQIRMLLLNFGILSHKFIHTKEYMEKRRKINGDKIKHNNDSYSLEIYGRNALIFYNEIGFNLNRKQIRSQNLNSNNYNRNSTHDIIPNSLDLVLKLYDLSGETTWSLRKNYNLNINRILNKTNRYFTDNISRDIVIKMFNLFSHLLPDNEYIKWKDIINNDIVWVPIKEIIDSENETFDFSLYNTDDKWSHSIIYNGVIGEQTPNGISNWFHKQWVNAKQGKNKFNPIQLHWKMHPDRNQAWRDEQDLILGPRLAAQECFDANTRIYTKTGLKKISDIKVGDYVLTHKGRFKQVLRTYSHIDNDLLEIHSYNNKNIRYVTKNHPFMNMNNEWINICDIKNEQVLRSLPTNIDYDFNTEDIIFDLYENLNIHNIKAKNNSVYINDRRHKTIHNRYIKMDYDAGYVIGLYLAEGSKSKYRTVFSFNNETERYTWPMRLQKIIEDKFGLKNYTFRYKGSNTCDLEISSKIFSSFISFFVNGNRCYNKYLSDHIYDFNNREFYSGILDGVFRGDGCLTNTANKKISITSQSLIYDLKYISVLLGYTLSSIRIVNKEYKENYKSSWSDKNYNYHDTYILSFYTTKNVNINTEFTDNYVDDLINYSYKNSIFKNDMFISSKIYIEDSDAILPVYNIEVESDNSYVTEHFVAHNCDADFLSSGNTVVGVDTLKFYKDTFIKDPIEKRGPNKELWIWESPVYTKTYMISSDVSRGDGSDYSSAHVIDVETMTQVAEFKGLISTKDFGNFLVGLATEYNDALLIVENSTIGWAVLQQIIDRKYKNLYYTEQNLTYVDDKKYTYSGKIKTVEKKSVPGFTTSPKTRPLIINKLEYYFNQRDIILQSDRCLDELYAFIWNGNRAEAMKGYNDDLVMALAIGLWVRDTALQLGQLKIEATKANLDSITVIRPESAIYIPGGITVHDQWNIPTGIPGQEEDISKWML